MHKGHTVAVVIPAYRAQKTIAAVLAGMPAWVDHLVVVDDGSPDGLSAVLEKVADSRLCVIRHSRNQGVGAATVAGYRQALALGCEVVIKMDADGQMDPRYCRRLLAPIVEEGFDFAKGNRFAFRTALGAMPRLRLLGNLALTVLVKVVSGQWHCVDPTNGFFAITARVLARIDLNRLHRGYYFEISQLVDLGIVGATVADVPIPAVYGGHPSNLRMGRVLSRFPLLLARDFWYRLWTKYGVLSVHPNLALVPVGLLAIACALAFGIKHWTQGVATNTPATSGTVALAMVGLLVGLGCLGLALVLDIQEAPAPYRAGMIIPCPWTEEALEEQMGDEH